MGEAYGMTYDEYDSYVRSNIVNFAAIPAEEIARIDGEIYDQYLEWRKQQDIIDSIHNKDGEIQRDSERGDGVLREEQPVEVEGGGRAAEEGGAVGEDGDPADGAAQEEEPVGDEARSDIPLTKETLIE